MIPRALADAWVKGAEFHVNADVHTPDGDIAGIVKFLGWDALSLGIAMSIEHRTYEIWATHWGRWGDLPMFARGEALHLYHYDERHNPSMHNPYETIIYLTGR